MRIYDGVDGAGVLDGGGMRWAGYLARPQGENVGVALSDLCSCLKKYCRVKVTMLFSPGHE